MTERSIEVCSMYGKLVTCKIRSAPGNQYQVEHFKCTVEVNDSVCELTREHARELSEFLARYT